MSIDAEYYAGILREMADWSDECGEPPTVNTDDLRAAAAFIERQQAELKDWKQAARAEAGLRREFLARAEAAETEIERHQAIVTAELSYDANYLHNGGG